MGEKTTVSIAELMALLSVTRTTIYNYINSGYLTPIKSDISKRVYFSIEEVAKLQNKLRGK